MRNTSIILALLSFGLSLMHSNITIGRSESKNLMHYSLPIDDTIRASGTTAIDGDLLYEDPYWDDLAINISSVKLPPSAAPEWVEYKGSYVLSFENGSEEVMYFTAQLPHKYKHHSDIEFHLHVVYPDNNTGDVRWTFTYAWANIGDTFPTESTLTIDIPVSGIADEHNIAEVVAILPGTGKRGSSVLLCSVKREGNATEDTYGSAVYVISADFHHEIDKPGSDDMIPGP